MADPEPIGSDEGGASGNRLSPAVTAAFAVVWLLLMAQGAADRLSGSPLDRLQDPAGTSARMTSRDLATASGVAALSGPESSVLRGLVGDWDDTLDYAVDVHRDVNHHLASVGRGDEVDTLRARGRLAVLLAERGSLAEALELDLAGLPGLQDGLAFVYGDDRQREPGPEFEAFLAVEEDTWLGGRLVERYARKLGAVSDAEAIAAQQRERAAELRSRATSVWGAHAALVVMGAVAIGWQSRRGRRTLAGNTSATPRAAAPWTLADGLGVLVRGDALGRLYYFSLAYLPPEWAWSTVGSFLYYWGTFFSSLPLAVLIAWHLFRPLAPPRPRPFALFAPSAPLAGCVGIGLAAIAIDLLGSTLLGWGLWSVGVYGDWSETVDETLIWSTQFDAILVTVDYVAWAPLFEEIAFRGLLFLSLRQRLGFAAAAVASATVFSAVHFYSLPGFFTTWWSGLVWAWAYERTGTLWPGIVAHAVYNALFVAAVVGAYR